MTTINDLIQDALITDEDVAIASITGNGPPLVDIVDMEFIQVGIKATAKIETLVQFVKEHARPGAGAFMDMSLDDLAGGPSYITLGGWVGDQTQALIYMALGKHHKAWDIITPATLGITGEMAAQMRGSGFVMTSGFTPEFRSLLEA